MLKRTTKPRKCRACGTLFERRSMSQVACSIPCAIAVAERKRRRQEAKQVREAKEKLKTRSDYLKDAQVAFNRYVRARDAGLPCASCGATPEQKFGGTMDCSHYRSVGSAPHMRFHLHNVAAACVKCNRYLGGNVAALRVGLIARIGLEKVEALEADNRVRKFDVEYLKRIKSIFNKKANRLLKKAA